MTLDTRDYARKLEAAGVPRPQAEAHAVALRDTIVPALATKADLEALRAATKVDLEALRAATTADLTVLETKLTAHVDTAVARIESRIADVQSRMFQTLFLQAVVIVGLTVALIRLIK
jgi:hypothetical protein